LRVAVTAAGSPAAALSSPFLRFHPFGSAVLRATPPVTLLLFRLTFINTYDLRLWVRRLRDRYIVAPHVLS
jgi:hypothetical protein